MLNNKCQYIQKNFLLPLSAPDSVRPVKGCPTAYRSACPLTELCLGSMVHSICGRTLLHTVIGCRWQLRVALLGISVLCCHFFCKNLFCRGFPAFLKKIVLMYLLLRHVHFSIWTLRLQEKVFDRMCSVSDQRCTSCLRG